ncbi:hypothetical protein [Streptomyces sp. NPDC008150]|uniref:hypothetical protein n=1 Tax=Streptomyces sp. NPDC008150 TaxID=3364816 RepID=UPI0036EF89DA
MEPNDYLRAAVALLTEGTELMRRRDQDQSPLTPAAVSIAPYVAQQLVPGPVDVDPGATAEEAVRAALRQIEPRTGQMVGAFIAAYAELARVHDSGDTGRSSADILRAYALRLGDHDERDERDEQ